GGHGWRVHRASPRGDSERLNRLEQSVREELAADAFFLQYQPRVQTGSGRLLAVEALLRWRDPARGRTLPAQFLPLAEQAGLSGALDDWVMERALRQTRQWRDAGLPLALIVNVGAWQLSQPGYARRVAALLEAAEWPAGSLEIDVCEAALQADPEASLANIRALRRLGVQVVLDQFGSGEISLGLLKRYPLSAVKLDRALLRGLPRRTADAAFATALIQIARAMQVQVHAVGVETEGQRQFLAEAGCESWQGLLCSPALDARALERCAREQATPVAANDDARAGRAANE
ncbi:MAG TPA: EAL domain-containing protein, partial [Ideonella sp.]|nr:EAL domain-containing protein [Ideonella sp.]